MTLHFYDLAISFFAKGHERSIRAKKQILYSLIIKGSSILITLVLVPVTIHYLNPTKYGIWLTLSSIIGWLTFFDIGLGNGLRNRYAEAMARNDIHLAKSLVSTTYALLALISSGVLLLFFITQLFLDWTRILNTPSEMGSELRTLAILVVSLFCMQFVFSLIITILTADQKPAVANFLNFLINLFSLVLIFIISKITQGSLLYLGIISASIPVVVLFFSSLFFFSGKYRNVRPELSYVKMQYSRDLMSLGIKFFIIQIASLIMFSTSNIILTQMFSPYQVTVFNIGFKYFGVITMLFAIIISPLWSAFTEAYTKNDIPWIKNVMRKQALIWIFFLAVSLLFLLLSDFMYSLWIGKSIIVPMKISFVLFIYVNLLNWNAVLSMLINGIGTVKLIAYLSILITIINVPLSILFSRFFGPSGVILGSCTGLLICGIAGTIQYKKIIGLKAHGIWAE